MTERRQAKNANAKMGKEGKRQGLTSRGTAKFGFRVTDGRRVRHVAYRLRVLRGQNPLVSERLETKKDREGKEGNDGTKTRRKH